MEEEIKDQEEEEKEEVKEEGENTDSSGTGYVNNNQNGMGGIMSPQP